MSRVPRDGGPPVPGNPTDHCGHDGRGASSAVATPPPDGSGYAQDEVEAQLQLVVPQQDEVEHEQVEVVLHALLVVLVDAACRSSLGMRSTTSKVSASKTAIWSMRCDMSVLLDWFLSVRPRITDAGCRTVRSYGCGRPLWV
ncbi:hypothetical protein [Stackebrandtia albiflava]|uniref:hypothetical protein n=1 Tax=Stackebrandtia albiflava TaxID=406432 RepID=UPI00131519DB|nr:hypothetical protein [Stackebrandtia albiflava]